MNTHPRRRLRALAAGAALTLSLGAGSFLAGSAPAAAAPVDHCGSDGTEWVPDRGPGFDFAESCRNHDLCYGSKPYGSSPGGRAACDYAMAVDTYDHCRGRDGIVSGMWCTFVADLYYTGVRVGGAGPFERAQPPTGTVIVGPIETLPPPPPEPKVTVGEPEVIRGGGGRGGIGGGGGGPIGGGSLPTGTVTVGEPETVEE